MKLLSFSLAGAALLASMGASVAQDAAAGEKVFMQVQDLPSDRRGRQEHGRPGPQRRGRPARRALIPITIIPTPIRVPASPGTRRLSRNISETRKRRFLEPRWFFRALSPTTTSPMSSPTSSSLVPTARKSDRRDAAISHRLEIGPDNPPLVQGGRDQRAGDAYFFESPEIVRVADASRGINFTPAGD